MVCFLRQMNFKLQTCIVINKCTEMVSVYGFHSLSALKCLQFRCYLVVIEW